MKRIVVTGLLFTFLMNLTSFCSEKSWLQSTINMLKPFTPWYRDPLRDRLNYDGYSNEEITIICPSTKILKNISDGERWGVCHNYAISETLGLTGKIPQNFSILGCQDWYAEFHFLEDYCQKITSPQEGDLVIYKDWFSQILHTGLVYDSDNELIESKWGTRQCTFLHRKYDVPAAYGNYIEYYRPIKSNSEIIEDMHKKIMLRNKSHCINDNNWLLSVTDNPEIATTPWDVDDTLKRNMWVNPNITNDNQETPLILTAKHPTHAKMIKIAQLLITYKADINHQDKYGNTALITASKCDNMAMVELLHQQKNCNKKLRDNAGKKASFYEYQNHPAAPYIFRRMAKPTKSAQSDFWHTINS